MKNIVCLDLVERKVKLQFVGATNSNLSESLKRYLNRYNLPERKQVERLAFFVLVGEWESARGRPPEEVVGEQEKTIEYRFIAAIPHKARSMTSRVYRGEDKRLCDWGGRIKSHPRNKKPSRTSSEKVLLFHFSLNPSE